MAAEWIRQVIVRPDGVYLNSKSNNDDRPYRSWKSDSLTEIYQNEGQRGLDREIVRMLSEYAQIKGTHASMERYRPCLLAGKQFLVKRIEKLNAEYAKLTPEDIATIWLPDERKTDAAKAYRQFSKSEDDRYYTRLAEHAAPLETEIKRPPRSGGAR